MLRRCVVAVFASLLALPLLVSADAPAASSAADVITSFHAVLLANMKHGAALGCNGRKANVATAVDNDLDVEFIAQRVLRRHWSALSADQQKQYVAAFRDLVVATYASQFSRFGGESFATLDTQDLPGGDRLVHTKLTTGSGSIVALDYALHPATPGDGKWRVVNIIADGVSDLALRSTQYDKLFQDGGYDQVLSWIVEQKKKTLADCS